MEKKRKTKNNPKKKYSKLRRSRSRSKEKKREQIEKRNEYNPYFIYLSKESNKKKLNKLENVSNFDENSEITIFEKKEYTKEYIKKCNSSILIKDIEEIYLDETIPEYQILKLKNIVNQINNNEIVFEKVKDNINKIGIILNEKEFNDIIQQILDKNIKNNIKYNNYKNNIINCISYIKKCDENNIEELNKYIEEARNLLYIKKEYIFNNYSEILFCFFSEISIQLSMKINIKIDNLDIYKEIIDLYYDFLISENFIN